MSYIGISNGDGTYSLIHSDVNDEVLAQSGILGMKWGRRRFQNPDGTLTEAGKKRYARLTSKSEKLQAKYDKENTPKKQLKVAKYSERSASYHAIAAKHKADQDLNRSKAESAWTERGERVHNAKADKAHSKYVKAMKSASKYDSYLAKHNAKNEKIKYKQTKVQNKIKKLTDEDVKAGEAFVKKKKEK